MRGVGAFVTGEADRLNEEKESMEARVVRSGVWPSERGTGGAGEEGRLAGRRKEGVLIAYICRYICM